jgi:enoyl-CoA hydratase/carnithine racemase
MSKLEAYANSFDCIHMRREGGILELRLHTNDGPLLWGFKPHQELGRAFRAIGQDPENHVVILTGTGNEFTGPRASEGVEKGFHKMTPEAWEPIHAEMVDIIDSLLSIQSIVIAAVNGPATRHIELALLSDIIIATENAEFQDSAHFPEGLTAGDGINVMTPMIMGLNRSRYFHLTGQTLSAKVALEWGLISEIVSSEQLMIRAWELARRIKRAKPMVIRHQRILFTHEIRRRMLDLVSYGMAFEGLEIADEYEKHRNDDASH